VVSNAAQQQVPEGYQQTEVGLIPKDWDVFDFGGLVNYTKGYAFKSGDYTTDGTRIIRVSDTTFDSIGDSGAVYISSSESQKYNQWRLKANDLIFSTVGSKPPMYDSLVGKAILVTERHAGSLLNQNAVIIRAKAFAEVFQKLLLSHFRTERYIDYIEIIYRGNANQASITLENLFQFKLPLPKDKKEQTAIANALSDVDALITSLEKLIAKKRAIKTAAMQQLLTGKKRLPPFDQTHTGYKQTELGEIPEDWESTTIGQVTAWSSGGTPNRKRNDYWAGDIPWISGSTLKSLEIRTSDQFLTQDGVVAGSKIAPANSTLLLVRGSALHNDIRAGLVVAPVSFNQDVKCLFPDATVHPKYLTLYIMNMENELLKLVSSAGNSAGVLDTELVKNFKFLKPGKEEQKVITNALSDMNSEIESLEIRLNKTQQLKQGMMQELLTGRTRLV
jgi:type I restriction enzyme S subunit